MRKLILILFFIGLIINKTSAQYDARWVMGTYAQLYFCDTCTYKPLYEDGNFDLITSVNNTSICDKNTGEILVFCHGSIIYNKNGVPMENGDKINSGKHSWDDYPAGLIAWNGVVILPIENKTNQYYVIYNNADSVVQSAYLSRQLYYSIVDMSYNNGLGKVIEKDIPLLSAWMECGRLNAIRHANGRDWWLLVNGFNNRIHYVFKIDQSGIKKYSTQQIGEPYLGVKIYSLAQTCVNQSGNQLAYCYSTFDKIGHRHRIDLYDFDRCSGMLNNYDTIPNNDSMPIIGCAFSPNDSLLYVNNIFHLFQYNVKDKNDVHAFVIDTFIQNFNDPVHVLFGQQKLAPNGKIYMGTWNGTRRLHCISKPNIRGRGCDFQQGYLRTDSAFHYFRGSVPNYPNFRLGVLKGSECDTIRAVKKEGELTIYPNPVRELLVINGELLKDATLQVYDVLGREIPVNYVSIYTNEIIIDVKSYAAGLYLLQVKGKNEDRKTVKFVRQ